jgi:hypothetical protein
MLGGHLVIAVVDKVPDLNFEPICRDAANPGLGIKDNLEVCMEDERDARDQLAQQWSQFDFADRTTCIRTSTMNRTTSYVAVLTCLEMDRDARKLRQTDNAAIDIPEQAPTQPRERTNPPIRSVQLSKRPAPQPTPPEPSSAPSLLKILCLPGLRTLISACTEAGRH